MSGLAAIRDSKPDAVLLDIAMPGMDGFAVIGEIRSDPNLRNLAVIAVTAHVMTGDKEKYIEAGFDQFVAKPILDVQVLRDTIEQIIARKRG